MMPTTMAGSHHADASTPSGWKFWLWRPLDQDIALNNARDASVELSRIRVERQTVELFLDRHYEALEQGGRPH